MQTHLVLAELVGNGILWDHDWLCTVVATDEEDAFTIVAAHAAKQRQIIKRMGIVNPENVKGGVVSVHSAGVVPNEEDERLKIITKLRPLSQMSRDIRTANIPRRKISEDPLAIEYGDEADPWLQEHGFTKIPDHQKNTIYCSGGYWPETRQIIFTIRLKREDRNYEEILERIEFVLPYIKPIACDVWSYAHNSSIGPDTAMQRFEILEPHVRQYGSWSLNHYDGHWYIMKDSGSVRIEGESEDLSSLLRHFHRLLSHRS